MKYLKLNKTRSSKIVSALRKIGYEGTDIEIINDLQNFIKNHNDRVKAYTELIVMGIILEEYKR